MSSSIPTGKAHVEAGVVVEGTGAFVGALVVAVAVSSADADADADADAEDSSVMVFIVVIFVVGSAMEWKGRVVAIKIRELGAVMVLLRQ